MGVILWRVTSDLIELFQVVLLCFYLILYFVGWALFVAPYEVYEEWKRAKKE
jgi:hypothetical protein